MKTFKEYLNEANEIAIMVDAAGTTAQSAVKNVLQKDVQLRKRNVRIEKVSNKQLKVVFPEPIRQSIAQNLVNQAFNRGFS